MQLNPGEDRDKVVKRVEKGLEGVARRMSATLIAKVRCHARLATQKGPCSVGDGDVPCPDLVPFNRTSADPIYLLLVVVGTD